ncbi:MAG TPA: hypothetical protein PLW10_18370, partial [Myxococcota bacterium]|nr:hypothetical protein [Myxococcota bacterium]
MVCVFAVVFAFAGSASAVLREHRVHFAPSPSETATGYTLHLGVSPGIYGYSVDIGAPPVTSGEIVYAVDLEDTLDFYVAISAYDASGLRSTPSNELLVAAAPPPPPPPAPDPDPTP